MALAPRLFSKKVIKFLVIALSVSPSILTAQSDFEVPSKWAKAEAIITAQSSKFTYAMGEKDKTVEVSQTEELGILVNSDAGAATFKYAYVPKLFDVEIEVVRASGSVVDFDQDDARDLNVGDEVPFVFADLFKNFDDFEKVMLGEIGKGDEINLTYTYNESFETKAFMDGKVCQSFASQTITFPSIYPKGGHTVEIEMDKRMYLNYGTMADGPSISDESDLESLTSTFEIKSGQHDAYPKQFFANPARMYPTSKFEVIFCGKGKPEASLLMTGATPGEANEEFDQDVLKRVVYNKVNGLKKAHSKTAGALEDFLGELKIKGAEDFVQQYYRGFQSMVYNTGTVEGYSSDMFMGVMMNLLDDAEYPYDVIVGVSRGSATLDDMVLNSEIHYGLKVADRKDNYMVYPFTKFSSWDDKDYYMSGNEAFIYTHAKKMEEALFEVDDLPSGAPASNQKVVRATVKLADGFTAVIVNKNTNLSGQEKLKAAPDLVSVPDYHKAMLGKAQYQQYADLRDEDEAEDFKNRRKALYEMQARTLFDTVEYQRFSVKKTGYEDDNAWLSINEKFIVPDEVIKFEIKDSLRVYTVSLGAFIESDNEVSKADFKRDGEIFVDYPRIIDIRLRYEVPQGYVVFGFDAFDTDLSSDFASLKASAVQKDKEIVVTCSMVLKSTDVGSSEWQQLYSILDRFNKLSEVTITMAGN